nr:Fur-regulated basic protein FbpA [Bacillus subtilis]
MPSDITQTATDERREFLTNELIKYGQYESEDGQQLYELPLLNWSGYILTLNVSLVVKCPSRREIDARHAPLLNIHNHERGFNND